MSREEGKLDFESGILQYMQAKCLPDFTGEVCLHEDFMMRPLSKKYPLAVTELDISVELKAIYQNFSDQPFLLSCLESFFNDIYYQIEMAIETLQKSDGLSTHRSSLLNSHVSCLFFHES